MEQTNTPQQPSRKKAILSLLVLLALPAKAESADYETTLDRLGRLQALAEQYIEEKNSGDDPIDLTLSFTRVGDYNTDIWQLTAGTRDGEFEKYATDADPDLWDLQGMNTVELPNGQGMDAHCRQLGRRLHAAGAGVCRAGQRCRRLCQPDAADLCH